MNDDMETAETELSAGNSSFHKVGSVRCITVGGYLANSTRIARKGAGQFFKGRSRLREGNHG
jgi:hypothetical protein